jgi:hypothetical protein
MPDFPYLSTILDRREGVRGARLSCWVHCLRDAMYGAGIEETLSKLARPMKPAGRA